MGVKIPEFCDRLLWMSHKTAIKQTTTGMNHSLSESTAEFGVEKNIQHATMCSGLWTKYSLTLENKSRFRKNEEKTVNIIMS